MPHYHFDIHCENNVIEDFEGGAFPDLETAETWARKSIAELICEYLRRRTSTVNWSMAIRDCKGRTVRILAFIDVVKAP
jgi:hypothetical protein